MAVGDLFARVNEAALAAFPSLLHRLFPHGRQQGAEFLVGNINGSPGKSFRVNVQTGRWADFADSSIKGGDPVSLYAAVHGLKQGEAALQLGQELGIERAPLRAVKADWTPIAPIPVGATYQSDGHPALPPFPSDWGRLTAAWLYLDEQKRPLMYRVRFETADGEKQVVPLTWCRATDGSFAWRWKDLGKPRPLYGLERLASADSGAPILVVEGEKCVEAANEVIGERWVCLTWAGGVRRVNGKETNWRPLSEHKGPIYLFPDNDDEGCEAVNQLATILTGDIRVIRPDPAWGKGDDIADLIEAGWDRGRLENYIESNLAPRESSPRIKLPLSSADLGVAQTTVWRAIEELNKVDPRYYRTPAGFAGIVRDCFGLRKLQSFNLGSFRGALTRDICFVNVSTTTEVPVNPPDKLLISMIALPLENLPVLIRVVTTPVFTKDGRLIQKAGYDVGAQLYYSPSPNLRVTVPDNPTLDDVRHSRDLVDDMLSDFPFVSATDRAHAWALALLPLVREMIAGPTPLHRIEAPREGTGKGLLADTLLAPSVERRGLMPETTDDEEWRKSIAAALREGSQAIIIDNCIKLDSPILASVITSRFWETRDLGSTRLTTYPVNCAWVATVNNPTMSNEMYRRSIRIRLDAGVEKPEDRGGFKHPKLHLFVAENRNQILSALLTLIRYGLLHPGSVPRTTKGSFEVWSEVVGSILDGIGIEGFLAPLEDDTARDTKDDALAALFEKIWEARNALEFSVKDIFHLADALDDLGLRGDSDRGRRTSLGKIFQISKDRIISGFRLKRAKMLDGYIQYRLEKIG